MSFQELRRRRWNQDWDDVHLQWVVFEAGACSCVGSYVKWHSVIHCFLDTEWKSELINSRNFDKEIGHQNPRYSETLMIILLY